MFSERCRQIFQIYMIWKINVWNSLPHFWNHVHHEANFEQFASSLESKQMNETLMNETNEPLLPVPQTDTKETKGAKTK